MVTSRFGGVIPGTVLLSISAMRGDTSREAVDENFRRAAGVFGTTSDAFVCSDQTHTTNIRRVEKEDAGKGVTKEKDYRDVDGLITDVPGLVLATFYADCVPLYFVDPIRKAVGLSHSGWRGTVAKLVRSLLHIYRKNMVVSQRILLRQLDHLFAEVVMKSGKKLPKNLNKYFYQKRFH
mgnify:CR=1 FL=1